MSIGNHGAAALRQLRNRKYTPNMRVGFDKEAHRFYFKYKKGKKASKKLSAQEIAQLRHSLEMAKRHKVTYQVLAVIISLLVLVLLVWGVLFFIEWLQELPSDVYHKK